MKKVTLSNQLEVSHIIHGHWRLLEWNLSTKELAHFTQSVIELGVTTFDHADIYGDYECENAFGKVLGNHPELREEIQLISKCGIKLMSDKYPNRKLKTYDYSYNHIVASAENSLRNLQTDHLDLLLLHRPSPLIDPLEVSRAFDDLKAAGKVLHFGVSNFNPLQYEMLQTALNIDLITNQVEISPFNLSAFEDGNIEFFLKNKINPLAWSPLAGGDIFNPVTQKGKRLHAELELVKEELGTTQLDTIIYNWLLKHPVGIFPIVGTGKLDRIQNAVNAQNLEMTDEQWYRIFIASKGEELP